MGPRDCGPSDTTGVRSAVPVRHGAMTAPVPGFSSARNACAAADSSRFYDPAETAIGGESRFAVVADGG